MKQHTLQPKLRFPEFSNNMVTKKAGELFINHSNKKHNGNLEILAITQDKGAIPRSLINYEVQVSDESVSNYKVVEKGDFIISLRSFQGGIEYSNYDGICSPAYIILKSQTTIIDDYYKFYLKTYNYIIQLRRTLEGIRDGKMIPFKYFSDTILINPDLPEQQKIADYLSTIDAKITLLEEKKTELSRYKKAMMQKLFSQEIRFKPVLSGVEGDENGNDFSDWEKVQLKDILIEHKEKNKGDKYDEVLSVAKMKGVINQIEHLGRSYSAEKIDHYKVINPFDIVYTKSPTSGFPFGIIKQNKLNRSGVLSPLYAVFKPKTKYLGMILHDIFLSEVETYNYLVPLVQKGAKNTMNINNDEFLKGKKYSLPTSEKEQQKIADFLSTVDESIDKVSEQIKETQSFKKAMLQQMFV